MKFTEEELAQFPTLDEVEKEIFTPEEIKRIHNRAKKRSAIRKKMSESISAAVALFMAKEGIGFNELTKRLQISPTTTTKIIRGDANLTLETIALVAETINMSPNISFIKES
ncbi:MAG: hypothetical protein K2X39_09540 [Silvanigrellaceae bacterium]|nr:hypothetical protein [Silvanigrellaceae bacterium]